VNERKTRTNLIILSMFCDSIANSVFPKGSLLQSHLSLFGSWVTVQRNENKKELNTQ